MIQNYMKNRIHVKIEVFEWVLLRIVTALLNQNK